MSEKVFKIIYFTFQNKNVFSCKVMSKNGKKAPPFSLLENCCDLKREIFVSQRCLEKINFNLTVAVFFT